MPRHTSLCWASRHVRVVVLHPSDIPLQVILIYPLVYAISKRETVGTHKYIITGVGWLHAVTISLVMFHESFHGQVLSRRAHKYSKSQLQQVSFNLILTSPLLHFREAFNSIPSTISIRALSQLYRCMTYFQGTANKVWVFIHPYLEVFLFRKFSSTKVNHGRMCPSTSKSSFYFSSCPSSQRCVNRA